MERNWIDIQSPMATAAQRRSLHRLIGTKEHRDELLRVLSLTEADILIRILTAAETRKRSAESPREKAILERCDQAISHYDSLIPEELSK